MAVQVGGTPEGLCPHRAGCSLHHLANEAGRLMQSDKHFRLPLVNLSVESIIKVKVRSCGTHFRAFERCHLTHQATHACQTVRAS